MQMPFLEMSEEIEISTIEDLIFIMLADNERASK
jgi:hypothetical protein